MRRSLVYVALAGWSLGLAACGAQRGPSGPTPLEEPPTTPSPVAEVTFRLTVAPASPWGTTISLQLLDEVSGIGNNTIDLPLKAEADGTGRFFNGPSFGQKQLRFAQAHPHEILDRRVAEVALEQRGEMTRAETGLGGDLVQA